MPLNKETKPNLKKKEKKERKKAWRVYRGVMKRVRTPVAFNFGQIIFEKGMAPLSPLGMD